MVVVSQAYGCDFVDSPWKRRQLSRLMTRSLRGVLEPESFAEELARRRPGKAIQQQMTYTVRHGPETLYLVSRLDGALYARIDRNLAEELGRSRPVIPADLGQDAGKDRMGGGFSGLADAADGLAQAGSDGLSGACGGLRPRG